MSKYRFDKISEDAFNQLQVETGVLLSSFDPSSPTVTDANIITATTGGITASCTANYIDWGEDVDNVPINMMELKRIDSYECTLSFTALSVTANLIKLGVGAADVSSGTITPRAQLATADFTDIWWVGDLSDGGFVAVKLSNALSTGGFSIQSGKNAKGQYSVTMTGHVSIEAQDEVPMEFYIGAPAASSSTTSNP